MNSKSITIITLFQVFAIFGTIVFSTLGNSVAKEAMRFPRNGPASFQNYGFYLLIVPVGWLIVTLIISRSEKKEIIVKLLYICGIILSLFFGFLLIRSIVFMLSAFAGDPCLL